MKNLAIVLGVSVLVVMGGATASAYSCVPLNQSLSYGSRGNSVKTLQRFLVAQGYPGGGSWMITGFFGAATQTALRNFQLQQGLAATGSFNADTRIAYNSVACGGSSVTTAHTSSATVYPVYTLPQQTLVYPQSTPSTPLYPITPTQQVSLYSVSPNNGAVGTTLTILGQGFTTTGNIVEIGPLVVRNVTSLDGRSVSIIVPNASTNGSYSQIALGTYPLRVINGAGVVSNTLPFALNGYGTSQQYATIDAVYGPTTLQINQTGTWNVTVSNPTGAYGYFTATWNDGTQNTTSQTLAAGTQTYSMSHTYTNGGSYAPVFTLSSSNGVVTTRSAAVVQVSNTPSYSSIPTLSSIQPNVTRVGNTVTLYGTNFATTNTVLFNSGALSNVASTNNGTQITFSVPSAIGPYCPAGMACPALAQLITAGTYNISVMNQNGTSNPVTLTITN